ncbi:RNase adapter RapZ, partial [Dermabacter hominis]|uniref:RNase adapter RapZ n=1 Tax=Dermabacter hominis TaxID=36740 RepID=UPI0031832949
MSENKQELGNGETEQPSDQSGIAPEIVIITGLAGAGRETAAHALEDMGWYVVYNIAPQLIRTLFDLQSQAVGRANRFAVVTDPRSGPFFNDLPEVIEDLRKQEVRTRLVFLS